MIHRPSLLLGFVALFVFARNAETLAPIVKEDTSGRLAPARITAPSADVRVAGSSGLEELNVATVKP